MNKNYLIYFIAFILIGCSQEENIAFLRTNASGAILDGDTSLMNFKNSGMDDITDAKWKELIGFIPKKNTCFNKSTILAYPNPLVKRDFHFIAEYSAEKKIIGIIYSEQNGNLQYDRLTGAFNKITQYVPVTSNSTIPRHYRFIIISIDSCAMHNTVYLTRI